MTSFNGTTPVLRIFDEAKAREFYIDFLGFTQIFEHRFGDNFPIYIGISHSGCVLHLSEHHGDATQAPRCASPPMMWKPLAKCWPQKTTNSQSRVLPL